MRKGLFLSIVALAALSSCSQEDNINNINEELVPIEIGTSNEIVAEQVLSRAPLDKWSNTTVGLFALGKNSENWIVDEKVDEPSVLWNNVTGTITGEANTSISVDIDDNALKYYPKKSTIQYSFYGYYPTVKDLPGLTTAVNNNNVVANYTIDGSQDIIWGKAVAEDVADVPGYSAEYFRQEGAEIPEIEFNHKLTQLVFQFKREIRFEPGQTIKVDRIEVYNTPNKLTLTIAERGKDASFIGNLTPVEGSESTLSVNIAAESDNSITASDNAKIVGEPIMLYSGTNTLKFDGGIVLVDGNGSQMTKDPIPFTVTLGGTDAFEQGASYKVEFTIADLKPIYVNAKLIPWKDKGKIDGGTI